MTNDNIIFTYTRQQAIKDGIFVDVTEVAKHSGFKIPVALTTNLYHTHIKREEDEVTTKRLRAFLLTLYRNIKRSKVNDNFFETEIMFDEIAPTKIWAVVEAQSPTDPSPAINVMLPSDY